jgi:hypothetical protein
MILRDLGAKVLSTIDSDQILNHSKEAKQGKEQHFAEK